MAAVVWQLLTLPYCSIYYLFYWPECHDGWLLWSGSCYLYPTVLIIIYFIGQSVLIGCCGLAAVTSTLLFLYYLFYWPECPDGWLLWSGSCYLYLTVLISIYFIDQSVLMGGCCGPAAVTSTLLF